MELEYIISALSSFAALVAGGGWFVSYKTKKVADVQRNKSDNVDLTDKILEKYQKTVLDSMGGHEKRHDELDEQIHEIKCIQLMNAEEILNISQYLNGGFIKFKDTPRTTEAKRHESTTK